MARGEKEREEVKMAGGQEEVSRRSFLIIGMFIMFVTMSMIATDQGFAYPPPPNSNRTLCTWTHTECCDDNPGQSKTFIRQGHNHTCAVPFVIIVWTCEGIGECATERPQGSSDITKAYPWSGDMTVHGGEKLIEGWS